MLEIQRNLQPQAGEVKGAASDLHRGYRTLEATLFLEKASSLRRKRGSTRHRSLQSPSSGHTPPDPVPEGRETYVSGVKDPLAIAAEPPAGSAARPYAGCPRQENGTKGNPGGKVPSGKTAPRSPSRSFSAASRNAASTSA